MDSTELQTLCRIHPVAKGLCVIIANSRGNLPDKPLLKGVQTDLVNMQRTFETLKFAVMSRRDCSAAQMVSLLRGVATFSEYPPSYRRIAVVFAGHGEEQGVLCAHDGTVAVDDVLVLFQPDSCHPNICGIPKLFFIDACRGKRKMGTVVVERGATAVASKVVPQCGNILVAYSTMEGYKAHEVEEEGGFWMAELSKQLLEDKSVLDIIVNVNKTLMKKFQNSDLSQYLQQPECKLTINEHINLLKESMEESPSENSSNYGTSSLVSKWAPQQATSRPSGCEVGNHGNDQLCLNSLNIDRSRPTEHYQQQLDTFLREGKLQAYKEHSETRTSGEKKEYCTKIEGTIGGEGCVFQSEYMESDDESKEQAAMKAVNFIQCQRTYRGAICSPPSITGICTSFSTMQSPPSITGDHGDCRMVEEVPCEDVSPRSSRNYRQELNEWCQRTRTEVTKDFKTSGQSHMCFIKIEDKEFTSKCCSRKRDAEEDAAMRALQWLQGQQPASPLGPTQPGSMRLKEYCERHPGRKLTPAYELLPAPLNGPFQCRLTITSPSEGPIEVTGDLCKSKQDAKHSAADKALQLLE